jgi:hypothetical protein
MRTDIRNLMRRLRYHWTAPERAHAVTLYGGPWAGCKAHLPDNREVLLTITVGQWRGHYTRSGTWFDEPTNGRHKPVDAV